MSWNFGDLELWTAGLLVLGGAMAGFMNVVAGGGSLITMPLLIFLGVPPTVANGSARLGILLQNTTAVGRYWRGGVIEWRAIAWLVPPTLAGAALGAVLGAGLSDGGFRALLGWITLAAALVVALDLPKRIRQRDGAGPRAPNPRHPLLLILLFGVGVYGGMIQAGVGYLFLAVLTLVGRYTLVPANVTKVVLILAYTPIAVAIFAGQGKLDWLAGLLLAAGQAIGGWLGAAAALKRGARLIRITLVVVVIATAVKLLTD